MNTNFPEPEWIWDNVLALGCATLLAGQPKAGKSLFVRNLIKSILSEKSFLGRTTKKCEVLYLAFEEHHGFLKKYLLDMQIETEGLHIHCGHLSNIKEEDKMAKLEEYIEANNIELVVIDPLVKFFQIKDSNDYNEVYKVLAGAMDLARKKHVHCMIVHHSNKSSKENATQILGSTGFFGSVDGALLLSRNGNTGSVRSHMRYGVPIENCYFRYDGKNVLIFDGSKNIVEEEQLEEALMGFLEDNGSSSIKKIKEVFTQHKKVILSCLGNLIKSGQVLRFGAGTKGDEYIYSVPALDTIETEQHFEGAGNAKQVINN